MDLIFELDWFLTGGGMNLVFELGWVPDWRGMVFELSWTLMGGFPPPGFPQQGIGGNHNIV